jgi:hypothetical protein
VNPFGTGVKGGGRRMAAGVPDSDGNSSFLIVRRARATYTCAAAAGIVAVNPYCYTPAEPMIVVGTGDPYATGTSCMTATTVSQVCVSDATAVTLADSFSSVRRVMTGLKINSLSSAEQTSGRLVAYHTAFMPKNSAATGGWNFNTALLQTQVGDPNNVPMGMTVRARINDDMLRMATPYQHTYSSAKRTDGLGILVVFDGCSTTTVFDIEAIEVLEVIANDSSLFPAEDTETDPDFPRVLDWLNNQNFTATGHSFRDFIRGAGNALRKGVGFVMNNRGPIGALLKAAGVL